MDQKPKMPMIDDLITYIKEYGWVYRETTADGAENVILSNYRLEHDERGILLSFRVEGEFVVVSTVGLLQDVPSKFAPRLLLLNDTIKLVKIYVINPLESNMLEAEIGFELWNESWNKETFFSFLDMLCLGIEEVIKTITSENIPHVTKFITYS